MRMHRQVIATLAMVIAIASLPGPAPAQDSTATAIGLLASPPPQAAFAVRAALQRDHAPTQRPVFPSTSFENLGVFAIGLAAAKKKAKSKEPEGSATEKPDYGEKDQPQPIAPNKTDAEGVDSHWSPPAGVDPTAATPHTTPEVTDPGYRQRRAAEARARGEDVAKEDRLPQVLTGGYDVRRGEKVFRIPAGTVVEDAELTDEEWDHVVTNKLVREASYAEVVASKKRAETADHDAKMLKLQKEQIGAKPKKSGGEKAPVGATLVSDLEVGRAEVANAQVARSIAKEEVARGTSERARMMSGSGSKK